jgi:uncharacterized membrane protein YfcA
VDPAQLLAVLAIGATIGFLGGLFGKGGSAMATPLLVLAGIPPIVAVASPLAATAPSTLAASSAYWRARLLDRDVVAWTLGVGIPAAAAGAYATRWIGGSALVVATEVLLFAIGVRFALRPGEPHEVAADPPARRTRLVLVAAGVGLVSGILANTGGFLLAPLFVVALRLPIKEAFASSLAVATVLAVPGTVVHAALGHVDWAIVAVLAVAATPFAYGGARVAMRTHAARLERIYGVMLVVAGAALLAFAR